MVLAFARRNGEIRRTHRDAHTDTVTHTDAHTDTQSQMHTRLVGERAVVRVTGAGVQSTALTTLCCHPQDGSGYIDENELDALLKDLYEKNKKVRK